MFKLSDKLKKLAFAKQLKHQWCFKATQQFVKQMAANADKLQDKFSFLKEKLTGTNVCLIIFALYFYGVLAGTIKNGIMNTFATNKVPVSIINWNPFTSILTAISPFGIGIAIFAVGICFLFSEKFRDWLAGEKNSRDARGFTVLSEGTHGTSGFMNEEEKAHALNIDVPEKLQGTLLGKLNDDNTNMLYASVKKELFLNGHTLVFGASGAGKTQGFTIPFILQRLSEPDFTKRESIILVDPKGDLFEKTSYYAKAQGYTVKAYNLLDMNNSDGFNCLSDIEKDTALVQIISEVIIKNTSNANERQDFWEKAEKNLLMALILYVESMTDNHGNKLPIYNRSIGAIYKILSTESFTEIDDRFAQLPASHPAQAPYGIFKLANRQIWGNIAVGLGNRLSVYQNQLVDKITSYNEIDLELPGKEPCIYYCIISDHDSTLEFLSSMFFSLLFSRLTNYARRSGENGRLPVKVNMMMEEFCNIFVNDFKRLISVVRSRNIDCQLIVQSVAQLSDRFPQKEWEEIISNCDTQIFLGVNDLMTANFASDKCGKISVRTHNEMSPQRPLFSPFYSIPNKFSVSRGSTQRPLMLPDEIMRMMNNKSIVLLRGQKPLELFKIKPFELSSYSQLKMCKISDYTPAWRLIEDKIATDKKVKEFEKSSAPQQISFVPQEEIKPQEKPVKIVYKYELLPDEPKTEHRQEEKLFNLRKYSGAGKAVTPAEITKNNKG